MSPEQATGNRQLDARSDIYSLGAVVYEMLAGEPPHSGVTAQAVIAKLMTERPTRLRTIRDAVPQAVDDAVARALAKVPADRYPSSAEFVKALDRHETRPGTSAKRAMALGSALVLAVLAAAGVMLLRTREQTRLPLVQRQLTYTGRANQAAISPDGRRVAYVAS